MTAYASLPLASLLGTPNEEIIGKLLRSDNVSGFTQVAHTQIAAWGRQLDLLRDVAHDFAASHPQGGNAHLVLEYRIPRREKRIDAIIIFERTIALIEFKVGASSTSSEDVAQVLDYALDIAYYHAESRGIRLVPILCPTAMKGRVTGPRSDVAALDPLITCGTEALSEVLTTLGESDSRASGTCISPNKWVQSAYRPIPGVIEAAIQLFRAHDVRDIRSSLAGEERIAAAIAHIDRLVAQARESGEKVLCLLTGVPGSGKTLAGLQVAHLENAVRSDWPTVFITGNGPLLKVLRAALTRDYADQQQVPLAKAKLYAQSLLHSVHAYLAEVKSNIGAPIERVVVFDEAQRAWDAAKMQKMANRATQRAAVSGTRANESSAHSEPWQILEALDRHEGGAVVVALCGNGQEIHDGEAGLSEWVAARDRGFQHWKIVCSPVAAEVVGIDAEHAGTTLSSELHLNVPVRAHRAVGHALWVDAVLEARPEDARRSIDLGAFPILLVRDLEEAREWLWNTTLGTRRCGVLASSAGIRLRPYGIEVSTEFRKGVDYSQWFTAKPTDLRASCALEVAATEFECQGLELDRAAVCWSWDMPILDGRPTPRSFRGNRWTRVKGKRERRYAENKYRVLLTRAREAMIIWVPRGRDIDPTRSPAEADEIAEYLKLCGVQEVVS